jgi:hypothetical protein
MRPRVWPLALVATVFASAAARSCAEFVRYGPYPAGEPYANLFLACSLVAGPALVLAVFRVWRRRQREAWPDIVMTAKTMAIALTVTALPAGAVLWMALYAPMRWRSETVGYALIGWSALAWLVFCGGAVLTAVAAVRAVRGRHQAL